MSIQVKFFASLRESVGCADIEIAIDGISTVSDVWQAATKNMDLPENTLMAVNMEYVNGESKVASGDEVAFFPPVTGG